MTFDKLRVSIFEAYQNDEISRDTCESMLESVLDMEGNHIVAEAEAARNEFMGVALEAAGGSVEFAVLEKKATTFGQKIANAWEKFKAWVKKIIDNIKAKLGFKKKFTVRVSEQFDKIMDQIIGLGNSIAANAGPKEIFAAVSAVAVAGVGIFKGIKMITKNADDEAKKCWKASEAIKKITEKAHQACTRAKNGGFDTPEEKETAKAYNDIGGNGDNSAGIMSHLRGMLNCIHSGITGIWKAATGKGTGPDKEAKENLRAYQDIGSMDKTKKAGIIKRLRRKKKNGEQLTDDEQRMIDGYSEIGGALERAGISIDDYKEIMESDDSTFESSNDIDLDDDFDFESMLADLDI